MRMNGDSAAVIAGSVFGGVVCLVATAITVAVVVFSIEKQVDKRRAREVMFDPNLGVRRGPPVDHTTTPRRVGP